MKEEMITMVRVALLGMAHVHAGGYARQVQQNPDAEITCVWDDDAERGRPAAEQYGVPYVSDLRATVTRGDVDGVVVNAPTSQHPEVIGAALDAGKHVFTEKALTIHTPEADELVQKVRRSGVKFMISLLSRTRPETLFMRKALDEGLLGDVTMMRARVAHSAALDRWFKGGSAWFGDAALAGGGSLFDLGCHTVDVMRWFLGEPASVTAMTTNFAKAYDIDDQCVALIRFKSGALGILDVSWVHRAGPNTTEVYGTEGFVGTGYPGLGLQLQSRKLPLGEFEGTVLPRSLPKALPSPLEQWINAIARQEPMTITVEDGRNLTQLLDGIYESARSGREVRF
jgi:1,5-anhydro-D-fructose reductase (1,5-anhydro-D-mannitol-forming)